MGRDKGDAVTVDGEPTFYDLLQVTPDADEAVITAAYRSRMRRLHPDVNPTTDVSLVARINEAYEVLSDPARRRDYDEGLARAKRAAEREEQMKAERQRPARPSSPRSSTSPGSSGPPTPPPMPPSFGRQAPGVRQPDSSWTFIPGPTETTNRIAVAGVIFGVLGLCLGPFGFIPAIFMGFAGSKRAKNGAPHGGLATTAIVLGFIGLAFFSLILFQSFGGRLFSLGLGLDRGSSAPATSAAAPDPGASNKANLTSGGCLLGGGVDRPRPDPGCTPGRLRADAGDYSMCDGDYAPKAPSASVLRERKELVAAAYSSSSVTFTPKDVGWLIPPALGGSWDAENLWPVKESLNGAQIGRLRDRLCASPRTLTVEELAEAARSGVLSELAGAPRS